MNALLIFILPTTLGEGQTLLRPVGASIAPACIFCMNNTPTRPPVIHWPVLQAEHQQQVSLPYVDVDFEQQARQAELGEDRRALRGVYPISAGGPLIHAPPQPQSVQVDAGSEIGTINYLGSEFGTSLVQLVAPDNGDDPEPGTVEIRLGSGGHEYIGGYVMEPSKEMPGVTAGAIAIPDATSYGGLVVGPDGKDVGLIRKGDSTDTASECALFCKLTQVTPNASCTVAGHEPLRLPVQANLKFERRYPSASKSLFDELEGGSEGTGVGRDLQIISVVGFSGSEGPDTFTEAVAKVECDGASASADYTLYDFECKQYCGYTVGEEN